MKPGHIVVSALVAVLGLAAVFVAQQWLDQWSHSNPAPVVAVPQVPMKTVVVAAQPLRFGTEIKQEHLKEVEWAETAIPSGTFESIFDMLTVEGRRAVLSPIETDEPVLSWKITGDSKRPTSSVDDIRAISVRIRDTNGIAGILLPGDRVDVMVTRNHYPDILLQNVKILATDQLADERADQPKFGKTATLGVNSVDAQKLALAQTFGTLSLAWRTGELVPFEIYSEAQDGDGEETAVDLLAKNVEETFQAIETRISQMGQEFRGTQAIDTGAMPFDPNARVGVIRGMGRQEYRIPKLAGAGERTTLSSVVDDGMRAMSVRISDVHGVTGFVLPGDHVDIMLTRDSYTDILLQNIKVLAIDQRADKPNSGRTATVEVNTVDAQKLTLAQTAGTLSLALQGAGAVEAAPPRRIKLKDLGPETAVDLLAENMEESFQAIENRISQIGQEFKGTQPIDTGAMPFNPNASNCASLYAFPCRADGIMGPTDGNFSATGCDIWGQRVAKRCRQ